MPRVQQWLNESSHSQTKEKVSKVPNLANCVLASAGKKNGGEELDRMIKDAEQCMGPDYNLLVEWAFKTELPEGCTDDKKREL